MAGTNVDDPGFDAEFRADIRETMLMGLPVAVADRPTFMFTQSKTWVASDSAGEPWSFAPPSPGDVQQGPVKPPVQVLCAVEDSALGGRSETESTAGPIDESTVLLYMFEDEWAQVHDFTSVLLGGSTYRRVARLKPLSLYGVQLEVIKVEAVDET